MQEPAAEGNQLGIQDVLGIARRRWIWILIPALLGPLMGYLVSLLLNPTFASQAFVLVEQQKVPDAFVPSMVTDQLETRLMTMQNQILSRSRLQPIIEEFKLYEGNGKNMSMDDRVAKLRKDIKVTPIRPDSSPVLRGFYVEADATTAKAAQQICTRVLSMFMEENLKARSDRAESTTDFLAGQLQEAKQKLDASDANLAAFKSKYIGRLPSDEQTNLQMMSSLNSRLDAVNEAIMQAQQQRAMQASMLAQQTASARAERTNSGKRADLERKISELKVQLATLEARYTAEDPDVRKTKAEIETLQRQLAQSPTEVAGQDAQLKTPVTETAEVAQLRTTLTATEDTIRLKKAEQARLEQEMAGFQARIQLSPKVEEDFKGLTRDYESSLQFYNDLLTKKTQSEMVRDLEQKREGEQFRVMDSPSLPSKPSFPDRQKFALGGLMAGFVLGAALAAILDFKERFIHNERDVTNYLDLSILATIGDLDEEPSTYKSTAMRAS